MRIGYICPNYYPDMAGGIEWYSLHITKELARRGHQVHVYTQLTKKSDKAQEIRDKVKIHRIKSYGFFYRVKFWPGLRSSLAKEKFDAVMSLDYAQSQTWKAARYCRQKNIPLAVLLYDIQSQKKPRAFIKQIFLDIFDKYFAVKILKKADKIFIRTRAVMPWLKKLSIPENKVWETPCGLTDEELEPGKAENFADKFSIKNNIILFLGRIRKQKGIFLLLDAFRNIKKKIPDAKLLYIGPDDKEYDGLEFSAQLKEKIKEYGLKDVHILSPIYGQLKNDALSACDVLALPSSYEAFGQVLLQAMAQGKPVIGTDAGGAPFVVDHKKNGFIIKPWDQEKLEHYLSLLLRNKKLSQAMGMRGREKAKQYRYSELVKKLEKLLKTESGKNKF